MASPTPSFDIPSTIGPQVVLNMIDTFLFGIILAQVYCYFNAYPKDRRGFKLTVGFTFVIELLLFFFGFIDAWHKLGAGWGNPAALAATHWTAGSLWLLSAAVVSIVQLFYAHRIYAAGGYMIISGIVALLTLLSLTLSFYTGIKNIITKVPGFGDAETARLVLVIFAIAIASDIIIAASTITILALSKRKTRFKSTKAKLQRLVLLSAETGSMTASIALLGFVLFKTAPGSYYSIFSSIGDKAYAISMLASLNSRQPHRTNEPDFSVTENMEMSNGNTFQGVLEPTLYEDELKMPAPRTEGRRPLGLANLTQFSVMSSTSSGVVGKHDDRKLNVV
ncbi:hypothetical protein HGRIS_005356 [Hohenbuehelia grisea]|uniref:DUF6534 domain-containing protein n=1 Tax=Hohenbuehelia grisea TaxID=104357 RepID=A0ABR3JER0_9AGAR